MGLGFREVALTVDVPAEEMMFHQHVLNAFLQRSLLLFLGKKGKHVKINLKYWGCLYHKL